MTKPSIDHRGIPDNLVETVDTLARVGKVLSALIRRGALGGSLGAEIGTNTDGDNQKSSRQYRCGPGSPNAGSCWH